MAEASVAKAIISRPGICRPNRTSPTGSAEGSSPSPSGNTPPKESVWQVDVLDSTDTTAVVRIMAENWHGASFVDHHSLVKTDKGWKIVAKIHHTI